MNRASGSLRMLRREAARFITRRSPEEWPPAAPPPVTGTFDVLPAIYDPDQLERVVNIGFGRTLAQQKEKLDQTEAPSAPATRMEFHDITWIGGRFYTRDKVYFMGPGNPLKHTGTECQGYDHVVITNSRPGLRYFGHWLRDDCAAREMDMPANATLLSLTRPKWADSHYYETVFEQSWVDKPAFFARKMTVLTDIGFSVDKRMRLHRLRARLRQNAPANDRPGRIVYIRRGPGSVPRTMENEDALVAALSAAGVGVVDAESGGDAISREILDAKIIISIEGSQLSHATYNLAEGGAILVLQPPDRFYNPHHDWSRLLGMRYAIVVGQVSETSYTDDPDEVLRMLDTVARTIGG